MVPRDPELATVHRDEGRREVIGTGLAIVEVDRADLIRVGLRDVPATRPHLNDGEEPQEVGPCPFVTVAPDAELVLEPVTRSPGLAGVRQDERQCRTRPGGVAIVGLGRSQTEGLFRQLERTGFAPIEPDHRQERERGRAEPVIVQFLGDPQRRQRVRLGGDRAAGHAQEVGKARVRGRFEARDAAGFGQRLLEQRDRG